MKLTVNEAAERASVCPTIVYGWVSARLLPYYRIGSKGARGKIFIEEPDLAAYLESCRVEAVLPSPRKMAKPAKPLLRHLTLRSS
jgi:hypothetical protein